MNILGVLEIDDSDIERLLQILPPSTYRHPTVIYIAHRYERTKPESDFSKQQQTLRQRFVEYYNAAKQEGKSREFWNQEAPKLTAGIILPATPKQGNTSTSTGITCDFYLSGEKITLHPDSPERLLRLFILRSNEAKPIEAHLAIDPSNPLQIPIEATTGRVIPPRAIDTHTTVHRALALILGKEVDPSMYPLVGYIAQLPLTPDLALHLFNNQQAEISNTDNIVFPPQFVEDFIQCSKCIQELARAPRSKAAEVLTQAPLIAAYVVLELTKTNNLERTIPNYLIARLRQREYLYKFIKELVRLSPSLGEILKIASDLYKEPPIIQELYYLITAENTPWHWRQTIAIFVLSKYRSSEKTITQEDTPKQETTPSEESVTAPPRAIMEALFAYVDYINHRKSMADEIVNRLKFLEEILKDRVLIETIRKELSTHPEELTDFLSKLIVDTIKNIAYIHSNSIPGSFDLDKTQTLLQNIVQQLANISPDIAKHILITLIEEFPENFINLPNKMQYYNYAAIKEAYILYVLLKWFIDKYPRIVAEYLVYATEPKKDKLSRFIVSTTQAASPELLQQLDSILEVQSQEEENPTIIPTRILIHILNEIAKDPTAKLALLVATSNRLVQSIWENQETKRELLSLLRQFPNSEFSASLMKKLTTSQQLEIVKLSMQELSNNPNSNTTYLLTHLSAETSREISDHLRAKILETIIQQPDSQLAQAVKKNNELALEIFRNITNRQIYTIINSVLSNPNDSLTEFLPNIPDLWKRLSERQRIELILHAKLHPDSGLTRAVVQIVPESIKKEQLKGILSPKA